MKLPVSRRSMLRMAGAGSLLAVGNGVLEGCGSSHPPAADPARSTPPPIPSPSNLHLGQTPAAWSQTFQSGHGWVAAGAGTASSDMNDTSTFAVGRQSARATTNGSGRQSAIHNNKLPVFDLTGKMIRLVIRVDDVTHLQKMAFYVGTRSLADSFAWRFHTHDASGPNYVSSGDWVTVHLQWADVAAASGTYSLSGQGVPSTTSGFTAMSLAVYDAADGPVTYRLQTVEIVPDTRSLYPRGVVSITFDDSYRSVFDLAAPVMKAHGYAGTVYNIAQAVGTSNRLTLRDMHALQDGQGWEMAGHAYATAAHDAGYDKLTSVQVSDDFGRLREWLSTNGFASEHFAYPHGFFQPTSDGVPVDQIASKYFTTARSIISETTETLAPAMPYRLKALTGLNDGHAIGGPGLADLTAPGAKLDRCTHEGSWLVLAFHDISNDSPATDTQISQKGFAAALDAIASRGIQVATVTEALRRLT